MNCRRIADNRPRVVQGRHTNDCDLGELCRGCQPCTEPHCRVCGVTHANGSCAECVAETRANLREIARLCGALPAEVKHRGIRGEAMVLLGPTADPEARGHTEASYLVGRLPEGWLETGRHKRSGDPGPACPLTTNDPCLGCSGSDHHPVTVLLTWQLVWRDALEHTEADDSEMATAVDYLDRTLGYMADYPLTPFEDFSTELKKCLTHLQSVLHDQAQGDRANVGCFECGGDLERRLTKKDGFEDFWTCQGCRRRYTYAEYNFALRANLETATA